MWLEALSKPTPAMLMMWLANAVNLAVDLVLVPGRFGAPAAWRGRRRLRDIRRADGPDGRPLGLYRHHARGAPRSGCSTSRPRERAAEVEQRSIGLGAGASNFFEVTAFASMNIIAGWAGGLTVAAWTIVLNVASMVFMVPLGLRPRPPYSSVQPMARGTGWA